MDHEAHRRVAAGQDPAGDPRERSARGGRGLRRGALQARRLRYRRSFLRSCRGALFDALRHRAARGDRLRHLGQRRLRHADRRLGLALRADHRLFRLIWLSESVSTLWARWPLLLGVAFVIVVLFLRGGVVEAWARFWSWRSSKQKT